VGNIYNKKIILEQKFKMSRKARGYTIECNNYSKEYVEALDELCRGAKYGIYGFELAPTTGTPHLHAHLYYENPRAINGIKKKLDKFQKSRIEYSKGDSLSNRNYCIKDGDFYEYGKMPTQGERTDLQSLRDKISNGTRVDEIVMENPIAFHTYGRTLERIETIVMRKKFRTEMTKGIWYYGATGVGKSHKAFEDYDPETTYIKNTNTKWWDGYKQQDTVILNDFRGEISYNELLNLVDKWPLNVPVRNREDIPFTSKKLIITSSLRPEEIFKNRNRSDSIEQFRRRFEILEMEQKWSGGNNISPDCTILNHELPTEEKPGGLAVMDIPDI